MSAPERWMTRWADLPSVVAEVRALSTQATQCAIHWRRQEVANLLLFPRGCVVPLLRRKAGLPLDDVAVATARVALEHALQSDALPQNQDEVRRIGLAYRDRKFACWPDLPMVTGILLEEDPRMRMLHVSCNADAAVVFSSRDERMPLTCLIAGSRSFGRELMIVLGRILLCWGEGMTKPAASPPQS